MRKILGINISHHCSFAYFENNILKEYYEEDRFNKIKAYIPEADEHGIYTYEYQVLKKFQNITFDAVVFSSYDRGHLQIEIPIIKHCLKQLKYKTYFFDIKNHHIYHAVCGYYFSKFDEAIAIVSDGGSESVISPLFQTLQSIYTINKNQIRTKYIHITSGRRDYFNNFVDTEINLKKTSDEDEYFLFEDSNILPKPAFIKKDVDYKISNKKIGGLKYINYLIMAGFNEGEEGQMMGIAAYKDKGTDLHPKVLEIANNAQEETLQEAIELINQAKKYSECKNIILSGGYHMNCSNNFKLVKHFPEYNFFVDPIAYDGGTAVGAAFYYENYKK